MMAPTAVFVRLPNWLGDIMMARPALHALRRRWPAARFIGMARGRHHAVADRLGLFDELLAVSRRRGPGRAVSVWSAAAAVRAHRPGVAILMAPSFEAAATAWMARVPTRVGHETDRRRLLLTHAVPVRPGAHRADTFGDLAGAIGVEVDGEVPPLALTAADRAYADRLFRVMSWGATARPIFLNPAAAKTPRAWSSDRFRRLAERLAARLEVGPIVVHARAPFVAPAAWAGAPRIACVGDASLPELAALLARCAAYVGNDSGPAHLAAAVDIPTVTIFGPSTPRLTGPGPPPGASGDGRHQAVSASFACAPCRERFFEECPSPPTDDGRPPCLDAITIDRVVAQVDQVLGTGPGRAATRASP